MRSQTPFKTVSGRRKITTASDLLHRVGYDFLLVDDIHKVKIAKLNAYYHKIYNTDIYRHYHLTIRAVQVYLYSVTYTAIMVVYDIGNKLMDVESAGKNNTK